MSGGRGSWLKSKSLARSPRMDTSSRTVGRASGQPSTAGSMRSLCQEPVLDQLQVRVEGQVLMSRNAPARPTG